MTVRTLFTLAAITLGLANSTYAQSPDANQKLADDIKTKLVQSGVTAGARMSVTTQNGVVELAGDVLSPKQAELIVEQVMTVAGVTKVDTALKVAAATDVQPVANAEPPLQGPPVQGPAMAFGGHGSVQPGPQEPLPLAAPSQPAYDQTGPKLPPYAWPTYAPYPNYSRVAYPQAYPYNAFPFIGPFYPFPKVPLGWRSVKLEWDDGHWYLGRLSTPHDYWRVKFW